MNTKVMLVGATLALGLATAATAGTIEWTLSGVTFEDGAIATGTFSTDDSTGALSAFDITTSGGSSLPSFHYTAATSSVYATNYFSPNSFLIAANDDLLSPYIDFSFVNALTSAGHDALVPGIDANHTTGSWECADCSPYRTVVAGEAVSGGAVPEPASWALMILGVGGVGAAMRRRQTRRVFA